MCPFVGFFGLLNLQVWSTGLPCSVNYRFIICQLSVIYPLNNPGFNPDLYGAAVVSLQHFHSACVEIFLASKTVL